MRAGLDLNLQDAKVVFGERDKEQLQGNIASLCRISCVAGHEKQDEAGICFSDSLCYITLDGTVLIQSQTSVSIKARMCPKYSRKRDRGVCVCVCCLTVSPLYTCC